ncbi:hypothetical protein [Bradyrhizobium sp. 930_D9_N1_4]
MAQLSGIVIEARLLLHRHCERSEAIESLSVEARGDSPSLTPHEG